MNPCLLAASQIPFCISYRGGITVYHLISVALFGCECYIFPNHASRVELGGGANAE